MFQKSGDIELVKRMGMWSTAAQRRLHDGGEVLKKLSGKMARVNGEGSELKVWGAGAEKPWSLRC